MLSEDKGKEDANIWELPQTFLPSLQRTRWWQHLGHVRVWLWYQKWGHHIYILFWKRETSLNTHRTLSNLSVLKYPQFSDKGQIKFGLCSEFSTIIRGHSKNAQNNKPAFCKIWFNFTPKLYQITEKQRLLWDTCLCNDQTIMLCDTRFIQIYLRPFGFVLKILKTASVSIWQKVFFYYYLAKILTALKTIENYHAGYCILIIFHGSFHTCLQPPLLKKEFKLSRIGQHRPF